VLSSPWSLTIFGAYSSLPPIRIRILLSASDKHAETPCSDSTVIILSFFHFSPLALLSRSVLMGSAARLKVSRISWMRVFGAVKAMCTNILCI